MPNTSRPIAATRPAPPEPDRREPLTLTDYLKQYAQDNPASAAAWCFALGFVLGWKLKPW